MARDDEQHCDHDDDDDDDCVSAYVCSTRILLCKQNYLLCTNHGVFVVHIHTHSHRKLVYYCTFSKNVKCLPPIHPSLPFPSDWLWPHFVRTSKWLKSQVLDNPITWDYMASCVMITHVQDTPGQAVCSSIGGRCGGQAKSSNNHYIHSLSPTNWSDWTH